MSMIERVARAIATSEWRRKLDPFADAEDWRAADGAYDLTNNEGRFFFDEAARAAIEAFLAGIDREFEIAAWEAVRPFHDLSEKDIRSSVPKDFFRLAMSKTVRAALKGEAE